MVHEKRRTQFVLPAALNNEALDAGRRLRKPRPVLRFERFGQTSGLEDLVFYKVSATLNGFGTGVSMPEIIENLLFLKGWLCKHRLG